MSVQFNIIRNLILHPVDYTLPQAIWLIEQYILYRTNKKVNIETNQYTNITQFEKAITTADNYFRTTYGKLWH